MNRLDRILIRKLQGILFLIVLILLSILFSHLMHWYEVFFV